MAFQFPPAEGNKPNYDVDAALTVIIGDRKTGKTTFAASAGQKMLVLDFENSAKYITGCHSVPIKNLTDLDDALKDLATKDHNYKTVAVDSITALIMILEGRTVDSFQKSGKPKLHTVLDIEFGKGYKRAQNKLWGIVEKFCALQHRGIGTLFICHSEFHTKKIKDKEVITEVPNLHPKYYQYAVLGKADTVLHIRAEQDRSGEMVRKLYTKPALFNTTIGSRFQNLPPTIDPTWPAFAAAVKAGATQQQPQPKQRPAEPTVGAARNPQHPARQPQPTFDRNQTTQDKAPTQQNKTPPLAK